VWNEGQIGQIVLNDWHKEHTVGAIDYHNYYGSEHLTVAKQAQITHWISAVMTHEL